MFFKDGYVEGRERERGKEGKSTEDERIQKEKQ